MRSLILSILLMVMAGCVESVNTAGNQQAPAPANNAPQQPAPSPDSPHPKRGSYPDPSPPKYANMHMGTDEDGHKFADVFESDQVAKLPDDIYSVSLREILYYDFGREYRVKPEAFDKLTKYKQLKRLSIAVPIGDSEFESIGRMPALEELELYSFYELNAKRLGEIGKLKTLKRLTLHMDKSLLDEHALKALKHALPNVKVER